MTPSRKKYCIENIKKTLKNQRFNINKLVKMWKTRNCIPDLIMPSRAEILSMYKMSFIKQKVGFFTFVSHRFHPRINKKLSKSNRQREFRPPFRPPFRP